METISKCCEVAVYIDEIDKGTRCTICDSEVHPKTGRVLTERESLRAWYERDLDNPDK